MRTRLKPIKPSSPGCETPRHDHCHIAWRVTAKPTIPIIWSYLALFALCGGGLWQQLRSVLHHDPAWLIHGTEVFLGGGKLYRDVFELNPPLIFYLTVPPVWIAQQFGLFTIDVFVVYVFVLIATSLALAWALLRHDHVVSWSFRQLFLLAAALTLVVMPSERFGQREHLMVILSLPYLLLLVLRSRLIAAGAILSAAIGTLAALGFALKPYFLLVPAATELYLVMRANTIRRCFRPETTTLAVVGLIYFASILVFTPDYLTVIVPFAAKVYDSGYNSTLFSVLARPESILMPVILLAHLVTRRRQPIPELGDILSIAAVGFFAAYVMQMKVWSYHIYPLDAALYLLLASVFLQGLRSVAAPPPLRYLNAALAGLLAIMTASAGLQRVLYDFHTDFSFMNDMAPFVSRLPRGTFIYVFSAGVFNGFPMVNYDHLGWSSRFDTFWLLPGMIGQPTRSGRIDRFLRDAVVADLTTHPPLLVFVDAAARKYRFENSQFDYIAYFSSDPRFRQIWAGYREIARVQDFQIFIRSAPTGSK